MKFQQNIAANCIFCAVKMAGWQSKKEHLFDLTVLGFFTLARRERLGWKRREEGRGLEGGALTVKWEVGERERR